MCLSPDGARGLRLGTRLYIHVEDHGSVQNMDSGLDS